MEFKKYFVTIKGIRGMKEKLLIYARDLESVKEQALKHIKRHYTNYWKMKIVCILDMGIVE